MRGRVAGVPRMPARAARRCQSPHFALLACGLEALRHSARLRGWIRPHHPVREGNRFVPNLLAVLLAQVLSGRRMSRRLRSCRPPHPNIQNAKGRSGHQEETNVTIRKT